MATFHTEQSKASKYGLMVTTCDWRDGVDCIFHNNCHKCGWHPDVEERRKERIRAELADKRRCP